MRFRLHLPADETDRGQELAGLEELIAVRSEIPGPVLVEASKDQVEALLKHLRDEDDVCLEGAPPALIAHRLARLQVAGADFLTGVANRQSFVFRLEQTLAEASTEAPVSLLLVDVDHFKAINDQHGHQAGDQVLCRLAELLAARAAFTGRLGGNQFGQVLGCDATEATEHARALIEAVRSLDTPVPEPASGVTVSIGAATAGEALPARDLLYHADEALYAAKARGRDRAVHADQLLVEAIDLDQDVALQSFDDFTRVITERVVEGITRRGRRVFQELKEQADVDTLTELKSRRYMDRRLPFELERARAAGKPLTVAMLDIDHFGEVNKQHGWLTGDRVLAGVAERVRASVRAGDWIARYGGEELLLVLADTDLAAARPILERVRRTVEQYRVESAAGVPVAVTVSIGGAEQASSRRRRASATGGEDLEALLSRVSDRLLEAKRGGRNQVRVDNDQ